MNSASHIGSQLAGCYTDIPKAHVKAVCQLEYHKKTRIVLAATMLTIIRNFTLYATSHSFLICGNKKKTLDAKSGLYGG